jgi:hypothetical protein
VITASTDFYAAQTLTLAIPLGFFILVIVFGFFQRRPSPREKKDLEGGPPQ